MVPTVLKKAGCTLVGTVFNRKLQKGGSIMFWLGIHNDAIIGPFKIEGKLDLKTYCNLLENNFLPYIKTLSKKANKNACLCTKMLQVMHPNGQQSFSRNITLKVINLCSDRRILRT